MVNPQAMLQMAMQRCNDPKMRNIIMNNINNPQAAVQELCKQYPNIAQQIDGAIGQGQNPQQIVMNMLNNNRR